MDLELQGRMGEVVAIYEKWVADYPNFADAHVMLAGAHEQLGRAALRSHAADAATASTTQFELAADELRRAVDLTPAGGSMREDPIVGLIDLHGPAELNRPAEYERLVGEGLRRHPADPVAHAYAITLLARRGEPIDSAVRAARAAIPGTAEARTELAGALMARVQDDEAGVGTRIAAAALGVVNDALTLEPDDLNALEQKAEILRNQARRANEPERSRLFAEEASTRSRAADLHQRGVRSDRVSVASGGSRAELSATGSLRAVVSAELTYSLSCGGGGYAISLEDLAKPERRGGTGFISSDLSTNGAVVGGYRITLAKNARKGVADVSTAAATCNGSKANPVSSFFASAEPVAPASGDRFFAVDERGIIFSSTGRIPNPIVESKTVVRY
jgi:hypothetical protein